MRALPLRLNPGDDLRSSIEAALAGQGGRHDDEGDDGEQGGGKHDDDGKHSGSVDVAVPAAVTAAFVVQGIGSLSVAQLRYAGQPQPTELRGDLEILTLAGSVSPDGAHLHMTVSDAQGRVFGGHVGVGCIVRTTAELLLALLPEHRYAREHDALTGFKELAIFHLAAR